MFAAVVLAKYSEVQKYSEVESAIAGKGLMPGSSTKISAEIRAAVLGLRMALQLHKFPE